MFCAHRFGEKQSPQPDRGRKPFTVCLTRQDYLQSFGFDLQNDTPGGGGVIVSQVEASSPVRVSYYKYLKNGKKTDITDCIRVFVYDRELLIFNDFSQRLITCNFPQRLINTRVNMLARSLVDRLTCAMPTKTVTPTLSTPARTLHRSFWLWI